MVLPDKPQYEYKQGMMNINDIEKTAKTILLRNLPKPTVEYNMPKK